MEPLLRNIINEYFGDYKGYALEAGAYDGIFESTTYDLEKAGWVCLCIEPNPNIYKQLIKNRKYCLPFALASENKDNEKLKIYHNKYTSSEASFTTLKPIEKFIKVFGDFDGEFEHHTELVDVRTLNFCLDLVKFPKLDILSLDIESGEFDALLGIDLEFWKPDLLIIENIIAPEKIRDYLNDLNYNFLYHIEHNDIFVKIK